MVLVGIADLDEETAGKYPGIYQYGQCQSRAFIKGIFAFFAGGAAGLTASYVIKRRYPNFPPVYNVVFVAGGAIVTSYAVASIASKQCQRLWVNTAQQQSYTEMNSKHVQSNSQGTVKTTTSEQPSETPATVKDGIKTTKYGDQMG
ncbi:transmembrane protein 141-like [Patiria miniata]|uniref:Transmembrane protein 141 n=1 Tax=Patiria miniata TaxID=46514 RepID=A0A913Z2Q8_PATMI|nr:transmembrane protein 141-like [Patiria miniata]